MPRELIVSKAADGWHISQRWAWFEWKAAGWEMDYLKERGGINPTATHAQTHWHMQTHARDNIILASHTLNCTLIHRVLTFGSLLIRFYYAHMEENNAQTHTAHEWWHCQALLCSTLFAVSFEGLLSTVHPSSHLPGLFLWNVTAASSVLCPFLRLFP